ncbi:phosphopentomutase [Paremcibacter congregatus]|uniref:phosphopentomutase n=1 Tax=Paremcibacter congregatus TaxID=2043170 RepID=UPI003A8F2645
MTKIFKFSGDETVRAIIVVLDSFGVGETDDAEHFGDQGANTFGHIAAECVAGRADRDGLRAGPLVIPNLMQLGLGLAAEQSAGHEIAVEKASHITGRYGFAAELSKGKDTPSGHWEMAGVPVEFEWGYFSLETPSFPDGLITDLVTECDLPGVLGNCHASGTTIIAELGAEHIKTGKPIVYTSADSVFQIAAHEGSFGLDRLYEVCDVARKLVDPYNIGRVIARPFTGDSPETFIRTGNRRDLSVLPPAPTLLDRFAASGGEVISIGKIADIFAHQGITQKFKAHGNAEIFRVLMEQVKSASDNAILFANLVDFDMLYGHRRDVPGYAAALEAFDRQLPELWAGLRPDDVVVLTADHGCDPTWPGSDHTREHVPVIAFGPNVTPANIGKRATFADIGASLAVHLGLDPLPVGTSFL